jgi:hypothetical protein
MSKTLRSPSHWSTSLLVLIAAFPLTLAAHERKASVSVSLSCKAEVSHGPLGLKTVAIHILDSVICGS